MTAVTGLRIGRRRDVAAAVVAEPPLSWIVEGEPGWRPAQTIVRLDGREERILGPDSVLVDWPFAPLADGGRHLLEVRVRGEDGILSDWSAPLAFPVHLLDAPWAAPLLSHPSPPAEAAPLFLRREIAVPADVVGATLLSTAQGVHRIALNGVDVGDHLLAPGWTAYRERLGVQVAEVGARLRRGARNVLTVRAAGGWFTERYGFGPNAARVYGAQPAVSLRLLLSHADGTTTDAAAGEWRVDPAPPLVASGLYAGESYDARRESTGWVLPGFDDAGWPLAQCRPFPDAVTVEVLDAEPVVRLGEVAPVAHWPSPDGIATIVDFGENLVGRVRLRLDAPAGAEVTIRHAEMLEDGRLCTRALRAATSIDRFVADGLGARDVEPEFTFHGFRYAEVSGAPVDGIRAVVLGSDLRRTGWFSCSDPLLNTLHENVVRSLRGNLLAVPSDCPQRDERLGWTGDAQVFAAAAASVFDVDAFFGTWLDDLALEQRAHGGVVPTVVPDVLGALSAVAVAGWGDAVTIVPSLLAGRYGDDEVVRRLAPAMRDWVEVCEQLADGALWERGFQYGDWLDPASDRPDKAKADPGLVASAFRCASARLAAEALSFSGDLDGAARAAGIADRAVGAFRAAYLTSAGRLMSDAPTAYALVLVFDLAPESLRPALGERLAFLLRAGGYRMATGFLGTPFVLDALLDQGQELAAERLLFQTMCPSWLYPVTQGATTMWERWDAVRPDGSLHPSGMLSLNHCAFGAVADVLHRRVGGLAPAAPGYRRIRVQPWFPESLDHAEVRHETPYGMSRVGWERLGAAIHVSVRVLTGADAEIVLPGRDVFVVGSGTHEFVVEAPRRERHPLGVDADLADLADAPGVCGLVSSVLAEHSAEMAAEFDAYIRWVPGRALRPELVAVGAPPAEVERVDAALRELSDVTVPGPVPAGAGGGAGGRGR